MLPFDLPPPIPIYAPAPQWVSQAPFVLANEKQAQGSVEEKAFHQAVSKFQQRLSKLSPQHKAEIRKLHTEVVNWADKQRAAGMRADKLATFVEQVMGYADKHLQNIERADPKLLALRAEHKQFQDLFLAGNEVIEAYLAWVRTDYKPLPKPIPKKV